VSDRIAKLAHALRIKDVLVVERRGSILLLQGGFGRGAGWAGTVELDVSTEPLLRKATPNHPPVRFAAGAEVEHLTERIQAACEAWRGSMADLRLSLSIGWAAPEPFEDLETALGMADERMYHANRAASV
jgi:hypothetical protein